MREFLKKLIKTKEDKAKELRQQIKDATTADEVRSLGDALQSVLDEVAEAREKLADLGDDEPGEPGEPGEPIPNNARRVNPLASFSQQPEGRSNEEPYSSMEYRMAFKNYVQRGTPIPADVLTRAGGDEGTTIASDLGMIIPSTVMNEFIKEVSKVYGQVYSKVRKINIKGGVKFPISKLKAKFTWITETSTSNKQKAGDIKEYIEFSYNIGEIRVAETLLAQVVSLPLFEREIVRIMTEAYVETMDKVIIAGTGAGQPLGITTDPRVTNVVEFTTAEFANWTAWRKKLFSQIPLSKRGQGEFLFTAATVESNLLTMVDGNNRPIFKEATELNIGESATAGRFYGRNVTLVEPDVIADFDTAASGDIVGIYWIPTDYVLNTNMAFGMKRYFDDDTNEWINKGLTIVDGKILDTAGCYLIKKK